MSIDGDDEFGIDEADSGSGQASNGAIPAGLSTRERKALQRTRLVARLLDEAISVPGTNYRVGLDAIIGLLPVSGDLVTGMIGLYIVAEAGLVGTPREVLGRMLGNLAIDVLVGSVPAIGDLFDAAWKANAKNVALFEEHLESNAAESV